MPFEEAALVAGPLLAFIGFVHTLIGLYEWHRDRKLLKTCSQSIGKIVDTLTYPQADDLQSGQYYYVAEFKTDKDITYRCVSRSIGYSEEELMNKEVTIFYDPQNPSRSRFKNDSSIDHKVVTHSILILVGIGLFLYGAFNV